jgi:hypothetical protein
MVVIWQQLRSDELELLQRLAAGRAQPDGSEQFDRLFAEDLVTRTGSLTRYGYSLLSTMNE